MNTPKLNIQKLIESTVSAEETVSILTSSPRVTDHAPYNPDIEDTKTSEEPES